EVKRLIEAGLKECLDLAAFVPVVRESGEKLAAEDLIPENENNFKVLEVANEAGAIRVMWNLETKDFGLEFSDDPGADPDTFSRVSLWRLYEDQSEVKDVKSIINDFDEAIRDRFVKKVAVGANGVKMPIPVSRTEVRNAGASYDINTLASRFATLYPEFKDTVKENIATYGCFLAEEFFSTHAAPKVLEVVSKGTAQEVKKLVGMFNELYDDGSNDVQQIICVTLLGQFSADAQAIEKLDTHMSDSLKKSVHNVNKYLASGAGKKKRIQLFGK
ncbi:MAG: hypothetical protein IKY44_05750, partial [Clostridia bacterium]|nr:hypothetical protein [Clostridia bacterium]